MLNDFEDVNRILLEMVDDRMVEPIDDPNLRVDFMDWADVIGNIDDFEPVEMVDNCGEVWYVS